MDRLISQIREIFKPGENRFPIRIFREKTGLGPSFQFFSNLADLPSLPTNDSMQRIGHTTFLYLILIPIGIMEGKSEIFHIFWFFIFPKNIQITVQSENPIDE